MGHLWNFQKNLVLFKVAFIKHLIVAVTVALVVAFVFIGCDRKRGRKAVSSGRL